MKSKRIQRIYDHRLVLLVHQTGDATIATRMGVPRSTVAGWLSRAPRAVTTDAAAYDRLAELRASARRQLEKCTAETADEIRRRRRVDSSQMLPTRGRCLTGSATKAGPKRRQHGGQSKSTS